MTGRRRRTAWAATAALLLLPIAAPVLAQPTPASGPAPAQTALPPAGPAEMISGFRSQHGQGRVTLDPTLTKIARDQAAAMAAQSRLDHDVLGPFSARMAPAKAGTAAENIAYGYDSFPKTLDQWITSPSHRKNLLMRDATRIGVASVRGADRRTYWAMVIAGGYDPPAKKQTKQAKDAKRPPVATAAAAAKKPKPATKQSCTIKILNLCI